MKKFTLALAAAFSCLTSAVGVAEELVITFGGDVNFNRTHQAPATNRVSKNGRSWTWPELTAKIAPLVDGDINFANIETVITDKRLPTATKRFVFATHSNPINHMIDDLDFNLFSLANNHAFDHSWAGYRSTLDFVDKTHKAGKDVVFHGVGLRADLIKPAVFEKKGKTFAFSAIGILTDPYPASDTRPGMLSFRKQSDFDAVIEGLKNTEADFKILSIHAGTERMSGLNGGQRDRWRKAAEEAGIDLVLGHHPHVARPVDLHKDSLIFYSLGNYLMIGAADMDKLPTGLDYGMFGRVFLSWDDEDPKPKISAVEIVPLRETEAQARPMTVKEAYPRIDFLNRLNTHQLGSVNLIFDVTERGTGRACLAANYGPRAKDLCEVQTAYNWPNAPKAKLITFAPRRAPATTPQKTKKQPDAWANFNRKKKKKKAKKKADRGR